LGKIGTRPGVRFDLVQEDIGGAYADDVPDTQVTLPSGGL
jgi:hypothetical protein